MRTLVLLAAFAMPLAAQQPTVQNGQSVVLPASSLTAAIKAQRGAVWLAYTVPAIKSAHGNWDSDGIAYLEGNRREEDRRQTVPGANYQALVLLRVEDGTVRNLRLEEPGRTLDAGGKRVAYLPGVDPAQSLSVLQGAAENAATNQLRDAALFAVSMHRSSGTTATLLSLAAANHDLPLREKAAFWLSTQYPTEALPALERWLRDDRDERFREKLTFDVSLLHTDAAADLLIRTAHDDSAPPVRKQAQFWMASLAGKRVVGKLGDAAEADPDIDVRKSAVFALYRLPNGEGTPRLIDLVRTSKEAAVRKQAVFWLGQSNDPRALAFLAQLVRQ